MNYAAVFHRMDSEYSHAVDENTVCLRLRAAKGDLASVVLWYGDRAYPHNPVAMTPRVMERVGAGETADWFQATFAPGFNRICYYFQLVDGEGEEAWYFGDRFHPHPHVHRSEWYQIPILHRGDVPQLPPWAAEAVLYQVFPDSFAVGRRAITTLTNRSVPWNDRGNDQALVCEARHGGTLRGIRDNLDWLSDLGIGALYLNPIFAAGKYHKYDTLDYLSIDPCLGTAEDFRTLVDECHRRSIRVILDGVFNHSGGQFFAFQDLLKNQEASRYRDWFYRVSFPVSMVQPPPYASFGYEPHMPKMNTTHPEVIEYFCRVGTHWIEEFGVDGWRLDVANEIDHRFWRTFRDAVRRARPDALLIGEVWEDARSWLAGDQFDSTMNYAFSDACRLFFAEEKLSSEAFGERLIDMQMRYPDAVNQVQMNLLDSHDVPRFLWWCQNELWRFQLAVAFQMTYPGLPSVFAGDERAMSGLQEADYRAPFLWGDTPSPEARAACPAAWGALASHPEAPEVLTHWYRRLIALRSQVPALRRGRLAVHPSGHPRVLVFERATHTGDSRALVVLNGAETAWKGEVPSGRWQRQWGEGRSLKGDQIEVPPRSATVLIEET